MQRRRFISAVAGLTSLSLAGCSSIVGPKNKVENISFSVVDTKWKMEKPVVVPANNANTLIIQGVLTTSNGCMTAKFDAFNYLDDENLLQVDIAEKKDDDTSNSTMCTQALNPQPYKIQIQFSDSLPDEITVRHMGGKNDKFTIEVPETNESP